ncbi:LOW QUALITY PROTEIN: hypothetical protein CVT25_001409, partial [Psilocybe cyanescens]
HSKLPINVRSWKKTLPLGSDHQTIWDELRPLLQRHSYLPKIPRLYFPDTHKLKNASLMNWNHFLVLNGISHAARRLHDSQDVILRVITAGGQGHTHLKIYRRLIAPPDILMSNNHILPILHEIIYQDITIVAVPTLMFDPCPFLFEDMLHMVLQMFEGTAYLHRNLIAYRDLFLANFMVEWMPESLIERSFGVRPRVYIIDFETAVEFPTDSTDRKCSDPPVILSEYGRPVAPELSSGLPYCPFRLDMWQIAFDLYTVYHTGLIEIDTLWADLTVDAPEDRPTADEAMQMLDTYLRKTPPSELHRPGPEFDVQVPVQVATPSAIPNIPATESLTDTTDTWVILGQIVFNRLLKEPACVTKR